MTSLDATAFRQHRIREATRFQDVLADVDPTTPVPTCPDWTAADLLHHLSGVQWFWTQVLTRRPAAPEESWGEVAHPAAWADLLALFDETSTALDRALDAGPRVACWTWSPDQTVGFVQRRQAHEALIHRVDAELTAGLSPQPIDPVLAADGAQEALSVMFAGAPAWGTFTPDEQWVRVDLRDVDQQIWVQLGRFTGTDPDGTDHDEDDLSVVTDPGHEPDAVLEGDAAAVDLWLWRRGDSARLDASGDSRVGDRLRRIVEQPST